MFLPIGHDVSCRPQGIIVREGEKRPVIGVFGRVSLEDVVSIAPGISETGMSVDDEVVESEGLEVCGQTETCLTGSDHQDLDMV